MKRNPIILGRKNCSRCKRWLHVIEFPCQRRHPLKLQSQCRSCAREVVREWYRKHPEKRAEYTRKWREANLEERREIQREAMAKRRKDPKLKTRIRRQARNSWRRMRKDPARWEARLADQRAYYAKRQQDPEWVAEQVAKRRAYYERVGRDAAAARTARLRLRQQFMGRLLSVLYLELERREELARVAREHRREWYRGWLAKRRAMMLAGEMPDEPEFIDGALERLPVGPLVRWLEPRGVEEVAETAGVNPRALRRYVTGESAMVPLSVVDAIVVRSGVMLMDIYDPGEFPSLYEVPEDD